MFTITDANNDAPLVGARVQLQPRGADTALPPLATNPAGRVVFTLLAPGNYEIEISQLGYETLRDALEFRPGLDARVTAALSPTALRLDPLLVVVASRRQPWLDGFQQRRTTGLGTYFDRDAIEARNPIWVSDLLATIPGVRLVPAIGSPGRDPRMRGGCQPDLYIDGTRISSAVSIGIDHHLSVGDVEAIEIYRGVQTPAQFGPTSCGAVVIWTRAPEPDPTPRSLWRRVAVAAGFVLTAVLLTR